MTQSIWLKDTIPFSAPTLKESLHCDICIVGGGLSGIYSAYLLAKAGFNVVLLEANAHIAHGTTAYSTGKLTVQHELIYQKLSTEQGKIYYAANQNAIEHALTLNDSSYQQATSYLYSETEQGKERLLQEAKHYEKIGIPFSATNETELPNSITLALAIENEGQINPIKFTTKFAELAKNMGARLF